MLPGSMTVPPWFQWEVVVAVVVVAAVLAVVALVLGGTRPGAAERAEWQAWLASRSAREHPYPAAPPGADHRRADPAGR
ncbi:hypothetical protein BKA19_1507 [Blastococcus saxobsidens]|uniref:Uncharacterized protein n=2 Tax=Blastococcus saxobsidens TaxID=138336 RepID=A0A4Q7Y794_9ACTN|nr:hypothetical protein BKA19_1507 [Blastococcus saxobsidens]